MRRAPRGGSHGPLSDPRVSTSRLPPLRYRGSEPVFRDGVLARLGGSRAAVSWFGLARHKLTILSVGVGALQAALLLGLVWGSGLVVAEALLIVLCLLCAL